MADSLDELDSTDERPRKRPKHPGSPGVADAVGESMEDWGDDVQETGKTEEPGEDEQTRLGTPGEEGSILDDPDCDDQVYVGPDSEFTISHYREFAEDFYTNAARQIGPSTEEMPYEFVSSGLLRFAKHGIDISVQPELSILPMTRSRPPLWPNPPTAPFDLIATQISSKLYQNKDQPAGPDLPGLVYLFLDTKDPLGYSFHFGKKAPVNDGNFVMDFMDLKQNRLFDTRDRLRSNVKKWWATAKPNWLVLVNQWRHRQIEWEIDFITENWRHGKLLLFRPGTSTYNINQCLRELHQLRMDIGNKPPRHPYFSGYDRDTGKEQRFVVDVFELYPDPEDWRLWRTSIESQFGDRGSARMDELGLIGK